MVRDNTQAAFDFVILVIIVLAIYYLKMQGGDTLSPADGVMSLLGLN